MKVFHDAKLEQINFLDERFYFNGELYFPSVTTILEVYPKGYGFTEWLKGVGFNSDEIVRRAGEQGSRVHDMIDQFLKGFEVNWVSSEGKHLYSLDEWEMFLRFIDFWKEFKPEIIANETKVCSRKLKYGGTIDLVCKINKEVWLIDFKTSNALYPSYDLQIGAYSRAWNELNPKIKVERHAILWVKSQTRGADKTGKKIQGKNWILKEPDRPLEELTRVFNHCHAIWEVEHPNYEPKNKTLPSKIHIDNL